MTRLGIRPYAAGDEPAPGSVSVTVVILTKNEEANVDRCLSSVAWAAQVVVVDSGSTDATLAIARARDVEIIEQPWLGYAAQREFAIRHPVVRHDWVYFVDADEWVSGPLAREVAQVLRAPAGAAYAQRFRVVFEDRWIRHCGWYGGSWIVRLMDRRHARFGSSLVGERASIDGGVGRLRHDLVDDDRKGLAAWLHKHVDYAAMEARQRGRPLPAAERLRLLRSRPDSRPLIRAILKDLVFPVVPAKPAALFAYMYLARFGFLDGLPGLRFCFYHAWYESCVAALRAPRPEPDRAVPVRLGVLDFHPIQYHAPLYQQLAERGHIDLEVLYLRGQGQRAYFDSGFGVPVAWNVDLLSGYESRFVASAGLARRVAALARWVRSRDVVVIYGHSDPWMLLGALACVLSRTPYLLRGDAGPGGSGAGARRAARAVVARAVVSASSGGLAVGTRNAAFYRKYGASSVTFAPHSVDNHRFARDPVERGHDLLSRLGMPPSGRPVIMFCGKLQPYKRPLDLVSAVARLPGEVTLLMVGDGPLAGSVRAGLRPGQGVVTGFVNQAELPSYYHVADILVLPSAAEPWGLVVNEAMAAGALPVVSDGVGAAPDLVTGLGEIYPAGDVAELAAALARALDRVTGSSADADLAKRLRERVDRYGIEATAAGFEQAARLAAGPKTALKRRTSTNEFPECEDMPIIAE
jgi:glycosyltransferase involved in cell wall biosynthesis